MSSITQELDRLGIDEYLRRYRDKDLLRLLTCGSVDDGKSTLIGRLLHDSAMVYDDQLAAAKRDTTKFGTTGEELDFALLVDGLEAEREQGITIDVAYRYFTTAKRKFIIADCPGHEQYTRNMATGASNCDLAIILIDARRGVLAQTRRHSFIVSLLGIKHVVCAVNKMDLVDYSEEVFEQIRNDYADFSAKLQVPDIHFIPMSALRGENVVFGGDNMPWYHGGPLLDYLENVHIGSDRNMIDFRMPVQNVVRPNLNFRGFAGTIASGTVRVGDEVVSLPSGKRSKVKSIVTFDGELDEAFAPQAVTITLHDEIDCSRGDSLAQVNNTPHLATDLEAMVVWMHDAPLQVGKQYLIKHTTNQTTATIRSIRYRTDVNTMRSEDATGLGLNEIGRVELETMRPLALDAYGKNRSLGAFILIDRMSNATVAAGMIVDRPSAERTLGPRHAAADAGRDIHPRAGLITAEQRAQRLGQQPFTLWFTGLPRSGKTSLAFALEKALFDRGKFIRVLDGETMRAGLSSDLGFSPDDRFEQQRRAAELARLDNDLGLITIVAMVSPIASDRARARAVVGTERFFEVFCDAPIEVCEQRDTEGLFERARRGETSGITGIDAPYEAPKAPLLRLDTAQRSTADNVERILLELEKRGLV